MTGIYLRGFYDRQVLLHKKVKWKTKMCAKITCDEEWMSYFFQENQTVTNRKKNQSCRQQNNPRLDLQALQFVVQQPLNTL